MQFAELKDWGTFIAAMVAAGVSTATLVRQVSSGRDKIHVGLGSVPVQLTPGEELHVENRSAHAVTIEDYGLIQFNGELYSIPWAAATENTFVGFVMSGTKLEPRGVEQAGMEVNGRVAGIYAKTLTSRHVLRFYPTVPLWRRAWIRLLVAARKKYS